MANKGVAIRLGTEGKAEVKSAFAEVRQAGENAFKGIGDAARELAAANDQQLERLSKGYDKAVAEMEAADRRRAASATKINAIAPKSAVQSTIDSSVDGSGGKSARESAEALRELLVLEDAQVAKASAIKAILDPLAAAQARYNAELAETRSLQAAGKISAEELAQFEGILKQRLEQLALVHEKGGVNANLQRIGLQQLSYQMADVGASMASGIKPMVIFAQQGTQVVQSVALMTGGVGNACGEHPCCSRRSGPCTSVSLRRCGAPRPR